LTNLSFSVNLFGSDRTDQQIFPLRLCKKKNFYHMDLLQVDNGHGLYHFILIKCMSSFLGESNHRKKYYCYHCMDWLNLEVEKSEHIISCKKRQNNFRIEFPKASNMVYKLTREAVKTEMYICADFETENTKTFSDEKLN
jgi:hypothetical protein